MKEEASISKEARDILVNLVNQRDSLINQIQTFITGVRIGMGLSEKYEFNGRNVSFEREVEDLPDEKKK